MSLSIYRIFIFCDFFLSVFSKTAKTRKIFGILWSGFICRTEEVEVDVYTKFHRARSIRSWEKIGGTEKSEHGNDGDGDRRPRRKTAYFDKS